MTVYIHRTMCCLWWKPTLDRVTMKGEAPTCPACKGEQ